MTQEAAETLALKALGFLVNRPEDIDRFLALSGVGLGELRERAGEPEFLAGVAEFLLANETLLIAFCETESLDAREVHRAHHMLAGAGE